MFCHKFVLAFILLNCFCKFHAEETECPKSNRANVLQTIVLFDASPENQMDFQQQKDRVIKTLRDIDRFSTGRKRFYELIVFHRTPMERLQSASIDQITEQISTLSMVNSHEISPAKALNEARTVVEKMPQAQSVILLAHDGHNTDLASETLTASARLSKKVPIFAIAGGKTPPALAKLDEYTGGERRRVYAFEQDNQQFMDALDEEIGFCTSQPPLAEKNSENSEQEQQPPVALPAETNETPPVAVLSEEAEKATQKVKKPVEIIRKQVKKWNEMMKLECGTNSGEVDLVLLLDTSGSMFHTFGNEVALVKSLLSKLQNPIADKSLRVSLISFAERSSVAFSLDEALNGTEMLNRLDQVKFSGGVTQICDAIDKGQSEMEKFGRKNALKVFVLISDGHGHELWPKTLETGKNLREQKMQKFAVSMSADYSKDELMAYMGESNRIFVGFRQTLFEPTLLTFLNECLSHSGGSSLNAENNDETSATVIASETTEPPPSETTVSAPNETTVTTASDTTEPPPSETTLPVPSETTVSASNETTVATPSETTEPPPSETTVSAPNETTVATPSETTEPPPKETTELPLSETTVATSTEATATTPSETTEEKPNETTVAPPTTVQQQESQNAAVEESKAIEDSNAPSSGGEIAAEPSEEEKTTEGSTISAVLTEQTKANEANPTPATEGTNEQTTTNATTASSSTADTASTSAVTSTDQTTVVNVPVKKINEQTNSTTNTTEANTDQPKVGTDQTEPEKTANANSTAKTPQNMENVGNSTNSTNDDQAIPQNTENIGNSTNLNLDKVDQAKNNTADQLNQDKNELSATNSTADQTIPAMLSGNTNATNWTQNADQGTTLETMKNKTNSTIEAVSNAKEVNTNQTIPEKSNDNANSTSSKQTKSDHAKDNADQAVVDKSESGNANLTTSVQKADQNSTDQTRGNSENSTNTNWTQNVVDQANNTNQTATNLEKLNNNTNMTNADQPKGNTDQSMPTEMKGDSANSTTVADQQRGASEKLENNANGTKLAQNNRNNNNSTWNNGTNVGGAPAEMQNVDDEAKLKMMIMSSLASQAAPHSAPNSTNSTSVEQQRQGPANATANPSAQQSAEKGKKPTALPATDLANERI